MSFRAGFRDAFRVTFRAGFRNGFRAGFRNAFCAHFRKLGPNVVIFGPKGNLPCGEQCLTLTSNISSGNGRMIKIFLPHQDTCLSYPKKYHTSS